MITEAYGLVDGKVQAGWTVLRDPQTGQLYDVLDVRSGKLPTPLDLSLGIHGPSSAGRCSLFGGPAKWRSED